MASTSDGDRPWQSYHTAYTNAKAGMDGVDKEKVQKVIYEMSKGSKYFENEKAREALIKQKIENLRSRLALLTEEDISHYEKIAQSQVEEMEDSRDLSKIWLHSDMDAFYASVETSGNPSLKGKPMAVGSLSMICTANYEARKFGVRAAMPGFIARKLCPDLILVPTNFDKYTYYSEMTRKVFRKYDPDFIATSLDEAYLNLTNICKDRDCCSMEIATELRNAIFEGTGLTCSVGVAPNRLLSKVCSDINKPNGQFILPNDREAVMAFISSLPIRKVGGIGKVTEHVLRGVLGINNCEDILKKSAFICALFSQCSADFFLSVGLGLGKIGTPESSARKSISCERTFSATDDSSLLFQKLGEIAEILANDMQKECLHGRTLTLKLKTASFEVRTRAVSLQKYTHKREEILRHACKLLKAELPLSLRLIGLRMSQFDTDEHGPVDPTQKTLKNYVLSDSHKNTCASNSSMEDFACPRASEESWESERCYNRDNDAIERKNLDEDCLTKIETNNPQETSEKNCFPGSSMASPTTTAKALALPPSWINGFLCSACGVELPPSFIEERLEHMDFHLAEMLQKEELILQNSTSILQHQRMVQKKPFHSNESAKKKRKSSPGGDKYVPIDAFFRKS